jgi:hypothetical protein
MTNCGNCRFAVIDYEEYYGTTMRQYFVSGCKKGLEESEDCEEFEELIDEDGDLP